MPSRGQGDGNAVEAIGQGTRNLPTYEETFQLQPYYVPGSYGDPYTPLAIPPPSYNSVYPAECSGHPASAVEAPPIGPDSPVPPYPGTPSGQIAHHIGNGQGSPPAYEQDPRHHIPPYPLTPTVHVPAYGAAVNYSNSVHPLSRRHSNPVKPPRISRPGSVSDLSCLSEDSLPSIIEIRDHGFHGYSEPSDHLQPLPPAVQHLVRVGVLLSLGLMIIEGLGFTYKTLARMIGVGIWSGGLALVTLVACHDPRERYHGDRRKYLYATFNVISVVAAMFFIAWYSYGLKIGSSYYRNCLFEGNQLVNCSSLVGSRKLVGSIPRSVEDLHARLILHGFGVFVALVVVCILITIWLKVKALPGRVEPRNVGNWAL